MKILRDLVILMMFTILVGCAEDPQAQSNQTKKLPISDQSLENSTQMKYAPEIVKLAESLGATASPDSEIDDSISDAPSFIREYAETFHWPESKTYRLNGSGEKLYGPGPNTSEFDLESIDLHGSVEKVDEEFFGDKCVYAIGMVDGGSYILLLDGDDKQPDNPMIYQIDHELEPDDEMDELFRLNEFLNRLEPN
jgi:hypothetical protein